MTVAKVVWLLALLAASASSSPLLRKRLPKIKSTTRVDGDYRLPNNTKPISYDLRLNPHLVVDNFTFDGKADVFLEVLEPTSTITLHTYELTYDESLTTLTSQDGVSLIVTSHTYVADQHFLVIAAQDELAVGNYTLTLTFVGNLTEHADGFYRNFYTNASGDTVWFAATQFESTSARRAFPCFDEPALKATFTIAIKHEPELHALSNMPIAQTNTDTMDGKVWSIFQTSPIMPTYLVAFVISDFAAIKNSDESYNVWSRPNAIDAGQYAYDVGLLELAELEDFTNIPYNLPKMDQIAFPIFPTIGMENWGLAAYQETTLLHNESESTLAAKQSIAILMSHEFTHQWFGNLVSPAWWKYLWLKEGFAGYFQWLITDAVENNWRLIEQFVVTEQQPTFAYDSSEYSVPMNQDVASPGEIDEKYDSISYSKAACIIRMVSHFLTEDIFKAGVTKFLNDNAFGAVVPDDLYKALQEVASEADILPADVQVKDVMDTWTEQIGFPVLTVTRNYTTEITEITQERSLSEDADATDDHDYKWWIPINWASQGSPDFNSTSAAVWMRNENKSLVISGLNPTEWVIFNKQQTGYYRVNYDDTNWGMIASYLNSDNYLNVHVLNRASLIDDAMNLARAGQLSYSVVLDLTLHLRREVDLISWYPAILGLTDLNQLLANTNKYETIRTYLAFLVSNVFDSVGIEETNSDDHITRLNRANIVGFACSCGLESCRSSAEAKLVAWLDDSTDNPISPTLKMDIICAGLRGANFTTWNKVFERCLTSESDDERLALIGSLGCVEDEVIINTWLNAIINSTMGFSADDSEAGFIYAILNDVYNVDRVFDFTINNMDNIISHYDDDETRVLPIISYAAMYMTTEAQLEKLKTFIADYPTILAGTDARVLGFAESNIAWNAANLEEINAWIDTWSADLEDTSTTEGYDTTTAESSAATAYLSSFAVILIFVCLSRMN